MKYYNVSIIHVTSNNHETYLVAKHKNMHIAINVCELLYFFVIKDCTVYYGSYFSTYFY